MPLSSAVIAADVKKPTADNPILNGPYEEPAYHYSTDANGNLNYADIREGRRVFALARQRAKSTVERT